MNAPSNGAGQPDRQAAPGREDVAGHGDVAGRGDAPGRGDAVPDLMLPPAGPPARPVPVGLKLAQAARLVSRAFDDALAAAGGTLPVWLILIALNAGRPANQRELAEAVGIQEATLTHHLNAMEAAGLITRERDPANRRVHRVQLTDQGVAMFGRLRQAAGAFDRKLRNGIDAADLAALASVLDQLAANARS
jgi:MarR family transcriptional regulator, transcriptional regulator for hemolysin